MENLFLEEIEDQFNRMEFELARINFDVVRTESTLIHCEKFSLAWQRQFALLTALKKKENLVKTKLASLAVDLSNEKTRIGL